MAQLKVAALSPQVVLDVQHLCKGLAFCDEYGHKVSPDGQYVAYGVHLGQGPHCCQRAGTCCNATKYPWALLVRIWP